MLNVSLDLVTMHIYHSVTILYQQTAKQLSNKILCCIMYTLSQQFEERLEVDAD